MKLKISDIDKRVAAIARTAELDDEGAHVDQDSLLRDVLQHIADECVTPQVCATRALRVFEIAFCRWYA